MGYDQSTKSIATINDPWVAKSPGEITIIGYPMVAWANLLSRASGPPIILPLSSGIPRLAFVMYESIIDKRFGKLVDRAGIDRLCRLSRFGTCGEDSDLGMADIAMLEGVKSNGTDAWATLPFSVILGGFVRGGGTWVFLGSTNI
jgi:hypothetical protein